MKVYVETPCRLHFSLIDMNGRIGRVDGSVGLALSYPNVIVEAQPSSGLQVEGLISNRVRAIAEKFMKHFNIRKGARISLK